MFYQHFYLAQPNQKVILHALENAFFLKAIHIQFQIIL